MEQILLMLLEHPLIVGFLVLCFLGLVGMTYDFILKLFGRKSCGCDCGCGGNGNKPIPPESSLVDNPDGPDDTLSAQEEVPREDNSEYVYD